MPNTNTTRATPLPKNPKPSSRPVNFLTLVFTIPSNAVSIWPLAQAKLNFSRLLNKILSLALVYATESNTTAKLSFPGRLINSMHVAIK